MGDPTATNPVIQGIRANTPENSPVSFFLFTINHKRLRICFNRQTTETTAGNHQQRILARRSEQIDAPARGVSITDTAPVEKFVTRFPDTAASIKAFYDDQVSASIPIDPESGTAVRGNPYPANRIETLGSPAFPHKKHNCHCKRAQAKYKKSYTHGFHSGLDFIRRFRAN